MLLRRVHLGAVLLALAGAAAAAGAPSAQPPPAEDLLPSLAPAWFDLTVNDVPKGQILARVGGGDAWLPVDDLERFGVKVEGGERLVVTERALVSLRSLAPSIAFQLVNSASVRPLAALISAVSSSCTAAAYCGERGSGMCIAQYNSACCS